MALKRVTIEARLLAGVALALALPLLECVAPLRASAWQINPGYNTYFDETQGVVSGPTSPTVNPNLPSSYAYYFDTVNSGLSVNALGFAIFTDWDTHPNKAPYDVYLWSYDGDLNPSASYNVLAKVTFDPALVGTYIQNAGYYWIPLPALVNLGPETASSPLKGFAVGAVGDFGEVSPTDQNARNLPYLFGGSGQFNTSNIMYDGNGFNNPYSTYYPQMNDPLDYYSIPQSANDPTSFYGFFNANVSFDVPAPAPFLGAAAAFRWSRRLRRRMNQRR